MTAATSAPPSRLRRFVAAHPAALAIAGVLLVAGLAVPRGSGAGKAVIWLIVLAAAAGGSRRPGAALVALCAVLPLTPMAPAAIHHLVPSAALPRALSMLDDGLAAGIIAAGIAGAVRNRRRPDALDVAALAWLALVTLHLFVQIDGIAGPTWRARVLGWRTDGAFVLLMLGARHAGIAAPWARRFGRALVWAATLVAATVLAQFAVAGWWETVAVDGTGLRAYLRDVLQVRPGGVDDTLRWLAAGRSRPSGVLLSPFEASDLCLLGLGPALHVAARRRLPIAAALSALMAVAVVVTRTRIALVALAVMALLTMRFSGIRKLSRAALIAIGVLAVAGVLVVATREIGSGSMSSGVHVDELRAGVRYARAHPLGVGLGTLPTEQRRFGGPVTPVSDNAFVQTAEELGVPGLFVFVGLVAAAAVALAARRRAGPDGLAGPVLVAFAGLVLTGLLHQVWLAPSVAWLAWAAVGVATRREGPA